MSIRVIATGLVAEGPSQPVEEGWWVVFVLDPFPASAGPRLAHACEVVCKGQELVSRLRSIQPSDQVEVIGELVMERLSGPLEDDLSGVRVWIKATSVASSHSSDAP